MSKIEKEIKAQKERLQAIKYLAEQGQSVQSKVGSNVSTIQRDNTLDISLKRRANEIIGSNDKRVDTNFKANILKQQSDLQLEKVTKSVSALPPNWKKVLCPESNLYYYWNTETNTTQWEKPVDTISNKVSDLKAPQEINPNKLESEWQELIHAATKQKYYYNRITGEKRSSLPSNTIVKAEVPQKSITKASAEHTGKEEKSKRQRVQVDPLDPNYGKVLRII